MAVTGGAALEEERRLAYVALSRAKERVYVSHIAVEPTGEPATASRFLTEIPPPLITRCAIGYG